MPRPLRVPAALSLALAALAAAPAAQAFCGFYVAGADAKLYNNATVVVLMREGTRTVLSMQNNYQGPPQDFAMVVPVPIVLQKENVKTLPREVFDRIDALAAPRLVEYWEQDPCREGLALDSIGTIGMGTGQGFGSGAGRLGGSHSVKIEAQFEVGEYEVVILSAKESSGLDAWLRENRYRIPEGAEPVLRPYVQAGMYFFVAKVSTAKVKFDEKGMATLSPLRFHYDANAFALPVRLGLLNSPGTQDLLVHVLADGKRYEAANYPSVTIPTNLDVREQARDDFGAFYAALFDDTLRRQPGAVVTEYAWTAGTCDPCPGPALTAEDVVTLGADVLPSSEGGVTGPRRQPGIRMGDLRVEGALPAAVIQRIVRQSFGRFRLCYENGLRTKPDLAGDVQIRFSISPDGEVAQLSSAGGSLKDKAVVSCVQKAFQGLSFPQPQGPGSVQVTVPLTFNPQGGPAPGLSGRLASMVLTRLHLRYDRGALGEDLILREAPAIQGGREVRAAGGALEQGSTPAEINNFQARYAIRHPWTGPVTCDKPVRGVWGGPPEGAAPKPRAGRDLAFARRGAGLDTFLTAALPAQAISPSPGASAAPAPAAPPSAAPIASAAPSPAAPAQGCGGCAAAGATPAHAGALALVIAALGLTRRRRR